MTCLAAVLLTTALVAAEKPNERFESAVRDFEKLDQQAPPPSGGIVFVGSSTIRIWNLKKGLADLPCINRGIGGTYISHTAHFADRLAIRYKPRIVVVGAGGNDLASGKSSAEVAADFAELVAKIHAALPETKIYYISLYPSFSRWKRERQQRDVNARIEAFTKTDPRLGFIDTHTPMTAPDGGPRLELLRGRDDAHMNETGYELWDEIVGPVVRKAYQEGLHPRIGRNPQADSAPRLATDRGQLHAESRARARPQAWQEGLGRVPADP